MGNTEWKQHEPLPLSQKQGSRRHCPLFTGSEAPRSNSWHPSHQEPPGEWEEAGTLILIQSPFFTSDLTTSSPFSERLQRIRGSFSVHLCRKVKQSFSPPEGSRKRKTPGVQKHSLLPTIQLRLPPPPPPAAPRLQTWSTGWGRGWILSDPMPGQVKVFIGWSGWLPTETSGTSPGKDTPEQVSIALFVPLFVVHSTSIP